MKTRTAPRPTSNPHPYAAARESVEAVVHLVHQARPGWDPNLVRLVLSDLARQVDGSDLAIAAVRAACDLAILTPKAIGYRGAHWRDLATAPATVPGGPRCTTCGKVESRCYGERPGQDDDHEFEARP